MVQLALGDCFMQTALSITDNVLDTLRLMLPQSRSAYNLCFKLLNF